MLTIEAYAPGGKDAVVLQASRLVVKTAHGNPICLVVNWGSQNQYIHADQQDSDFDTLLKTFGVESATILKTIKIDDT
jgi:hypothetical protein